MNIITLKNEWFIPLQYEIYSFHWELSSTCYFVKWLHLIDVGSMSLSFAGNPNFVNKLRLNTITHFIQYWIYAREFEFFVFTMQNYEKKLHLHFVTFLFTVSIFEQAEVAPIDLPKSAPDRFVIEVLVASLCCLLTFIFRWYRGFCYTLSFSLKASLEIDSIYSSTSLRVSVVAWVIKQTKQTKNHIWYWLSPLPLVSSLDSNDQ